MLVNWPIVLMQHVYGCTCQEKKLSAHEWQQEKTKRRIEQLEKANLETKDWTMQGEVISREILKHKSALEF